MSPCSRSTLLAGLLLAAHAARAEVTLPGGGNVPAVSGTFSLPHTLPGSSKVGGNLFHTFEKLNLAAGETAAFTGPADIANILARVTGERSVIHGKIQSDIPDANFYLINPKGVIFGPGAAIDVKGAFTATSAHYVRLGGGGRFDAADPAADVLTSAPVTAFGFLGGPQPVQIQAPLPTAPGKAFSIIAGDVRLDGEASIVTDGGAVTIASAASAGELTPGGRRVPGQRAPRMGNVALKGASADKPATIDTSGAPSGPIAIRAGNLTAENAKVFSNTNFPGTGAAMDLRIKGSLTLKQNARFETSTETLATAGRVTAKARQITVAGGSKLGSFVNAFTDESKAGAVVIRAGRLVIAGRSSIRSDVEITRKDATGNLVGGQGSGGHVDVRAGSIEITGSKTGADFTGISARALSSAGKTTRGVTVNAQSIRITQGGSISADSGGTLRGGDVKVTADRILIAGNGSETETSIRADSLGSTGAASIPGGGGNVTVNAGHIRIENGGLISAKTTGPGDGGNIAVRAGTIEIDRLGSRTNTGIASDSTAIGTGAGGDIRITADQIDIRSGGQITGTTQGDKPAGNVTVHAGAITLDGTHRDAAGRADAFSRIASESLQPGPIGGRGGNVSVLAETIHGTDGGRISATTAGIGASGNILITASDAFFSGKGSPHFTGIAASSTSTTQPGRGGGIGADFGRLTLTGGAGIRADTSGPGRGGSIIISADEFSLRDGAFIAASSSGKGVAGSVDVSVDAPLTLDSGSFISSTSAISDAGSVEILSRSGIFIADSSVTVSALAGNAGRIALFAPDIISLRDATLLAEAGLDGGDLFIDPQFVLLKNSRISANAILGRGGNIGIIADVFLASESPVTASSEASVQGTVRIETLQGDISGALLTLGSSFVSPKTNLAERCAMRLEGDVSTFLLVGRGGVASAPDDPAPAIPMPLPARIAPGAATAP